MAKPATSTKKEWQTVEFPQSEFQWVPFRLIRYLPYYPYERPMYRVAPAGTYFLTDNRLFVMHSISTYPNRTAFELSGAASYQLDQVDVYAFDDSLGKMSFSFLEKADEFGILLTDEEAEIVWNSWWRDINRSPEILKWGESQTG